ncbi:MAG: GGDEF domain-containing protein, partial [Pseudomonadota bacterium]
LSLDQASRLVVSRWRERAYEQFVITELHRYRGMARMIDLLEAMTNQRIEVARYSNPLTALPGNVPIYDCINGLIRRQQSFVLVQFDVDNFKPFNDFYGYSKGDEALIHLGQIIKRAASPRIDFVGHLGGDDFIVVFRSPDWQKRVRDVFADFEDHLRHLYQSEHLRDGGIVTKDRYGVERRFPLLSISAAGLLIDEPDVGDAESLAYHLAPLKAEAKRDSGSSLRHCRYADLQPQTTGMPLAAL